MYTSIRTSRITFTLSITFINTYEEKTKYGTMFLVLGISGLWIPAQIGQSESRILPDLVFTRLWYVVLIKTCRLAPEVHDLLACATDRSGKFPPPSVRETSLSLLVGGGKFSVLTPGFCPDPSKTVSNIIGSSLHKIVICDFNKNLKISSRGTKSTGVRNRSVRKMSPTISQRDFLLTISGGNFPF